MNLYHFLSLHILKLTTAYTYYIFDLSERTCADYITSCSLIVRELDPKCRGEYSRSMCAKTCNLCKSSTSNSMYSSYQNSLESTLNSLFGGFFDDYYDEDYYDEDYYIGYIYDDDDYYYNDSYDYAVHVLQNLPKDCDDYAGKKWCRKNARICKLNYETMSRACRQTCTGCTPKPTKIPITQSKPQSKPTQPSYPASKKYLLQPKCGQVNIPTKKIVGGNFAEYGNNPWIIHILLDLRYSHCGATLISPEWTLTAAHCLVKVPKSRLKLVAGDHARESDNFEQYRSIERIVIYPEYNKFSDNHDIALIKSLKPFKLNNYVQPACLPYYQQPIEPKTQCKIAGWGDTQRKTNANSLKEGMVTTFSKQECQFVHGKRAITNYMFCAGKMSGRVDTCQGDSGGPLVCKLNNKWELAGITSWGEGCARKHTPGVYAHTSMYIKWISSETRIEMNDDREG